MRSVVAFKLLAAFTASREDEGVLGVEGVAWFTDILRQAPGLELDPTPVQEDWGVTLSARHSGRRFDIGVGVLAEGEWIAKVQHGAFLQRLGAGPAARAELCRAIDHVLREHGAADVRWYDARDLNLRIPSGSPDAP